MTQILITGGAGFIGSHVAEHFLKRESEVIVFDNLARDRILESSFRSSQQHNWDYLRGNYPGVKMVRGDVRNFEQLKQASKGVDVIVHLAAQVAVTKSLTNPRMDFEINTLGTFNVLEMARLIDASVIYASTNKVYGENVNKIPIREEKRRYFFADSRYEQGIIEDFPIDLCEHTPYGCSKLAGDLYAQDYAHIYGVKTGVFRMSCIYGERQFGVEDQGWVAWFTIATILNRPITIYGNGKQVRDLLHVSDLITAYDAFMNTNLGHEVFNIGGGPEKTLSLLELLDLLERLTDKKPRIYFKNWRPNDQKVYVSNISKAKNLLNWEPKVKPTEGVKELVKWVRNCKRLFMT